MQDGQILPFTLISLKEHEIKLQVHLFNTQCGRKTEDCIQHIFLMDKKLRSHTVRLPKEGFFVRLVWQLSWENKKSRSCHCICCKGKLGVSKSFLIQTEDNKSDTYNSERGLPNTSGEKSWGQGDREEAVCRLYLHSFIPLPEQAHF